MHKRRGTKKTYRYSDPAGKSGPCREVIIEEGRRVSGYCVGDDLPSDLMDKDVKLDMILSTGKLRYCTSHDSFLDWRLPWGHFFSSQDTAAPTRCPSPRIFD